MSKSPFYKTGRSKSPLFDKGHGKDNESHYHATKTSTMPKTGTTDFPTTESRKSNYKLKDLIRAGADMALSGMPVGRIFKAAKGATQAAKTFKKLRATDVLDLSPTSSSTQRAMSKILHKFDKTIKPPKK